MLAAANTDVYTDFKGLAKLKNQAKKESPEAVKEVAKQFESIFLNNILKNMREAKLAEGALDNEQTKFFNEMYDHQLAMHLSGNPGVGLADLIVKQLSPPDKDKMEKKDAEDYLNRSAGVSPPDSSVYQKSPVRATPASAAVTDAGEAGPIGEPAIMARENSRPQSGVNTTKAAHSMSIKSADEFVRRLHPYAERAARELGVEPKVILAQAALESGWGRSMLKTADGENTFNLFNIKAGKSWQGKQAKVTTLEFDQGVAKKVQAGFRAYGSFEESFRDYVALIKNNPRYQSALKNAGNAEQYMHELQRAGYASDPKYANKVMSIYQGNTMTDFKPEVMVAMSG